ncbi:ATP-binding protein [Tunturibacter empetritectus]|uniref:ATP-binding protein n=1 Tax=Tunturiibacter empetritectus TaxID=3069691 RepID=UPI00288B6A73|nr:ATP-binding protein [Edaphobacter lichenicola]
MGIPAEVIPRIFEAFYTTEKATGNGIGFWLSQEIINKCGSKIYVKSILGRGTVFSFHLAGLALLPQRAFLKSTTDRTN